MSLKVALPLALILAAAPALAQPPAATPPAAGGTTTQAAPPAEAFRPSPEIVAAIQQAAQAFGMCVNAGVQGLPATATAEAGAATVLAGCGAQRQTLVQAAEAMIASMPEDQRADGHAQLESQMGQVEGRIADGIRQSRAAAAAAAATSATPPAPATPAATPTPH